jgi:hypothetical protein
MADDRHPYAWVRDLRNVADDALVKSLVEDFRHGIASSGGSMIPGQRPASTVSVVGSGKVQDPVLGPKYRPVDHSAITDQPGSGWKEGTPLRPPPGISWVDELVFQQDLADLEAKGREQAAAMGISFGDWVKLQLRERQEKKLRDKGSK